VSVEAISWALNLASVPRDRGGKPNPACKAVQIGLANHAGPDRREAFPAVEIRVRELATADQSLIGAGATSRYRR
jgi:hypothetical protein